MTTEEIKEAVKVMEAFVNGKKVQRTDLDGNWFDCDNPRFDWASFNYRVKPEPKHRPFKTQEECWEEMQKHQPFGWIMAKNKKELVQIGRVLTSMLNNVMITLSIDGGRNFNSSYYFNHYTFTDGTPFGIKEE